MIGSFTKKFYFLLVMLLCIAGQAFAGGGGGTTTYYSRATVQKATGTGEGIVYVRAAGGGTGTNTTVDNSRDNDNAVQFDLYATAADGYQFSGWSTTADGNSIVDGSNTSPWTTSVTSSSTDSNNPTLGNFYAVFTEASHKEVVGYVFYSGGTNGEYLANDVNGTTTFNPNNCIWTGTTGGLFTNGTYYLRTGNSNLITTNRNNATNETLYGTESGTTGQTIYGGSNYLRYNNGAWTRSNSGTASGRNVVFAVTKETRDEIVTNPAITGVNEISALGNTNFGRTDASYTQGYNDYIFYNGAHHYWKADDSQALSGVPTSESFTYTWSLSEEAEGHATVNNSGVVSYNTMFDNDTEVTLTLTARSSSGRVLTAEKRITFVVPTLDPTEIIANDINYIMVGEKRNINPSLICATPDYPNIYTSWTGITSQNTAVATVDANAEVTGVAPGTTTITISAGRQAGADLQKVISVVVKDNCVAPTITFSNADNTLTMSTTTPNAQIYYTLDGHDPTTASSVYDPTHKPVLSAAETVKAITISNDAAHYINSPITTLAVAKVATPTVTINGEQVVIACTTPGVTLHYTTDGSDPTASSPTTSGTINGLAIGTNVKVIAVKEGMINSNVATKVVKYNVPQPVLSFDGTEVTMTCPLGGAKIYYTTNGNNPTTGSTLYNPEAKPTITEPTTVKAIAVADGYDNSAATTLEIVRTATPGISVSGTTVTLSCATDGVTYYYTTDGSEPTPASASTTATTLDDTQVPPGATLKVMAVGSNLLPSTIASKEVNFELTAPEIEIAGGNVTITGPAGATIHYTTDGSEPTASSPTYTAPLTATNGMTYKAIAMKAGYTPSDITTEKYMIETGVANGVVTLNDYEDHTWTYYAGVDPEVDGGHYNTSYVASGAGTRRNVRLYSPNPRNLKITYNGVNDVDDSTIAVKVSTRSGEDQNTFIYYETLEEGATAGQYPYQVISNPFSVRPSTGTGDSKIFYGFAGWKIVSGGDYIDGYSNDDILPLDANITFVNLPYTGVNCTSADIVFQTAWTQANVQYGGGNVSDSSFSGGTYETNICVLTANSNALAPTYPVTITTVEPDGTQNYNAVIGGAITPANNTAAGNASYMTKIEYVGWNPGAAVDCRGRNFTIGRGVTMSGTTRAMYATNQTSVMNQVLKVESGSFTTFTSYNNTPSSVTKHWVTFGNDYDRAKKDNSKLSFSGKFLTAQQKTLGLDSTGEMARVWSKSGNFMTGVAVSNAAADNSYYFGVSNTHNNGHRYLEIQGGDWYANIAGGMGEDHTPAEPGFTFRMKGGRIRGSVYGAAAFAGAGGTRTYIITGGEINGWVAAGANGTQSNGGLNAGASYVYVGGNAVVDSKHSATAINRSVGGNVYGAGCGYSATSSSGEMSLGSNMVVADEAYIERGLYGGGAYGFVSNTQTSYIYITGGHVGGYTGQDYGNTTIQGGVYGGARQNKGGSAFIYMTGGLVETGIYGGSNNSGAMNGSVTMQINGGQVGTDAAHTGNIHGGGYGNDTAINQNVDITLGKTGAARDADGVTVWGDVYGGSALGSVNGTAASNTKHTNVTMNAGYIHGSIYGGALGSNTIAANVYAPVQVKVYGGSVFNTDGTGANGSGAVYGANNINGAPQRSVTVDIYGTNSAPADDEYALFSVYGGGNAADYTYGNGYPTVTVHNCDNSIEYVYGGGNAAAVAATDVTIYGGDKIGNVFGGGNGQVRAANVTGGTNVKIYGGTIGDVYGGSNTQGTIGGTINVNVNAQAEGGNPACPIDIDNVYGGGNKAASNVGNVTIGCAEHIGAVYGGANQANVTGSITLNIVSGHIDNVFGGNNNSGNISGSITVNVNDNGSSCGMAVGNVYGGGNLARYGTGANFPVVNIINGALTGSVYGGGKGETAVVTGNPQVNISDWNDAHEVTIGGNVFGGGDAAEVVGTPVVIIKDCDTEITGNIYGGGNAAAVAGTNLTIWGGRAEQVFGGGNGLVSPADVNGNASAKIYGGTFTEVYGGSNSQGDISGTISVEVNEHKSGDAGAVLCPVNIDDLYGGGNMADSRAGQISIGKCNHIGSVYGGANKANVEGDITLNITDGHIDNVFGGNNNSGNIDGNITVNVNWANDADASLGNVYGGGNLASINNPAQKTLTVNIINATTTGSVFGGGKGKTAVVKADTEVNVGDWQTGAVHIAGDVFGGGDLAAVEGDCAITIRDCDTYIGRDLYGGGNAAPVFSTNTTMWGGLVAGNIFGGGNGKDAALNPNGAQVGYMSNDTSDGGTGVASTAILGGTVGTWVDGACTDGTGGVFGGSNTNGNIRGGIALTLDQQTCSEPGATRCPLILREIYGAGNEAAYVGTGIDFDLGCVDYLEEIYGGAKAADLNANAVLTIRSGHFKNVFGGNNVRGKLNGNIVINIDETGCNPIVIENLYGGGNQAAYSVYGYEDDLNADQSVKVKTTGTKLYDDPVVNIISCTRIDNVFGAGLGASATMVGSPTVNVNQILGDHATAIGNKLGAIGTIYGGGNEAAVVGNTNVNVGTSPTKVTHISGDDQTTEYDAGANITGNIYGGGNQADVTGKTNVTVGK